MQYLFGIAWDLILEDVWRKNKEKRTKEMIKEEKNEWWRIKES
jgi:hypothetical protein